MEYRILRNDLQPADVRILLVTKTEHGYRFNAACLMKGGDCGVYTWGCGLSDRKEAAQVVRRCLLHTIHGYVELFSSMED